MPTLLMTGANRGLGLGMTGLFADAGWTIHACCRKPDAADELKAIADKGDVHIHALDVGDFAAIESLAAELKGTAIDVLFNNAGIMNATQKSFDPTDTSDAFGNLDFDGWMQILRINVMAPARMTECFVGHVAASDRKTICNMSSIMGSIGGNDSGSWYAYRTSKAALNMVTRSLAADLKDQDITVVSLHPGWVRTSMGGPSAALSPEESVSGLFEVVSGIKPENSGELICWDGGTLPW
jgi:NAD(P)-dependent dehydrogenase (short-subunit alcohol dehydrogenase family)